MSSYYSLNLLELSIFVIEKYTFFQIPDLSHFLPKAETVLTVEWDEKGVEGGTVKKFCKRGS